MLLNKYIVVNIMLITPNPMTLSDQSISDKLNKGKKVSIIIAKWPFQ